MAGSCDAGAGLCGAALGHDVARAAFALAALGGYAQFKLDVVEIQTGMRVTDDVTVADALADTHNHEALTVAGC